MGCHGIKKLRQVSVALIESLKLEVRLVPDSVSLRYFRRFLLLYDLKLNLSRFGIRISGGDSIIRLRDLCQVNKNGPTRILQWEAIKMSTLVISVDLSNEDHRAAIQELLCELQSNEYRSIVSIVYDEKKNVVRVSGTFNPKELTRTLGSKLKGIIEAKDIKAEKKEEKKDEPKPSPAKPPMYPWLPKPPMYPWPPQVTMVCFVCPCPCMTAWSNNYQSCSCGVERWPGRCGCRSGSGSRWGSGPRHGDRPQCRCEPSQQPNIGYESTPSIGYESMPRIGYELPGCESTPRISYESTPTIGYESMPNIGYESTEPSCSIM